MKNLLIIFAIAMVSSTPAFAETTQDHFKQVVNKTPHQVEVCYDRQVSGDKSGDMLKGAIIGGIIGNNVGDIKNGGAAGAIIVVFLDTITVMHLVVLKGNVEWRLDIQRHQ